MIQSLIAECVVKRAMDAQAAGSSDVNGDIIDTAGFDGVMFMAHLGAITSGAATSIKIQQGALSDMSDAADLEGTSQTIADTADGKIFLAEVIRPRERYLRLVVKRATQNAVVNSAMALLYNSPVKPVTQSSDVGGTPEIHASPAEGTA